MKPWWKKMGIIACCILCAGVVLSGIGWALGGKIVTLGDSLPDHSAAAVQRVFDRLEDFVHLDILNRVDDPAWPDTIEGVITEPYAFSSYWDGGMARVWEPSEETYLAVRMELEERSWPELYYFTAGGYGSYGTPWKQVGDHYFSTK